MELALFFICIIFYDTVIITSTKAQFTPAISERLALLRYQISDQIKQKDAVIDDGGLVINEDVAYEDLKMPFAPIDEHDPRKKEDRFKLRGLKTTRESPNLRNDFEVPLVLEPSSKKPKKEKTPRSKITDVFYKRAFEVKQQAHWVHCQDMIVPFLTGKKKNLSVKSFLEYNDTLVLRLAQLLQFEITERHTKDDIHSILYQLSNLPIRLFQWEVSAMKLLFNVIATEKTKRHSFRTIKIGLKHIFKRWNLAVGADNAMLLKQTRLFRPPCVDVSGREGSTLTPKLVRYTKPERTKKVCPESASEETCNNWNNN